MKLCDSPLKDVSRYIRRLWKAVLRDVFATAGSSEDLHSVMTTYRADRSLSRVRRLATVMDSAFRIPLTQRRIGLDSLVGLIPGIGDVATTAVSAIIVREAMKLGVRKRTVGRMLANIGIDMLIGSVPLLGDLFDFAFKANTKNVALLELELGNGGGVERQST